MRLLACAIVLAACGSRDTAPTGPSAPFVKPPPADLAVTAPGLRLPDSVEPLAYALRLDIDPAQPTFAGHVEIRVKLAAPTRVIWLHARDLTVTAVRAQSAGQVVPLRLLDEKGDQMIALAAPRELTGEATLELDYTGTIRDDQMGLFRQRADGKWFVYSQGQAVSTRLFVPSFDEPRWKTPWQVTLVVPAGQVALSNAPQEQETTLPNGRREVRFASIGPIASYLVAVAVGPFALVDAGPIGEGKTPFRVAVFPDQVASLHRVRERTAALLGFLEAHFAQPMPWPKLDLVAVPEFFGAMENPGLVTVAAPTLFDATENEDDFARVIAHELAHQWMGNSVTPAWWDDLWVAEAFAQFLGDAAASSVKEAAEQPWLSAVARTSAFIADATSPSLLRRPVTTNGSIDDGFDDLAYTKGAAMVAMLEGALGKDRVRDILRRVVTTFARRSITTADFLAAVRAVDAPLGDALASMIAQPGIPAVNLSLSCTPGTATVTTSSSAPVPICVRVQGGAAPACGVTGTLSFPVKKCPTWFVGNAGGTGYYIAPSTAPLAALTGPERMGIGADDTARILRGERTAAQVLVTAQALLARPDVEARYGGLAILLAIDTIVDAKTRPAWLRWVASHVRPILRLARERPPSGQRPARLATAGLATRELVAQALLLVTPAMNTRAANDLIVSAREMADLEQATALEPLASAEGAMAPILVTLVLEKQIAAARLAPALTAMLGRPDAREATWAAIQPQAEKLLAALPEADARALVLATKGLCTDTAATEVRTAFASYLAKVSDAEAVMTAITTSINRCVRVRTAAGDISAALRNVR